MILTTIAIVAQATPGASASPAATATPDIAKVTDTAKAWFASLQAGKVLDPKQVTDEMAKAFTPDTLTQVKTTFGDYGAPTTLALKQNGEKMGNTFYVFDVTCAGGKHARMLLVFDDVSMKISGLRMLPAP